MPRNVSTTAVAAVLLLASVGQLRAADCNGNGIDDATEPDCNLNGLPDDCDIAGKLYWTDSGLDRITRAYLGGTRVESLITSGLTTPRGIAVDVAGGKVYWSDVGTMKIQRANLDGSGIEDVVATGLSSPRGIALDVEAGKIYWTDAGIDKIQRANLDGTEIEDLVTSGLQAAFGIALDVPGGKMYWCESISSAPKIQRANLDGTSIENLVTTAQTGLQQPNYIALDLLGGKMYWTDAVANRVQRANLDGGSLQTIVSNVLAMSPTGIAVNPVGGKVYWSNNGDDSIWWANLDGTQADDLILAAQDPFGITIAMPVADEDQNGVPDECEGGANLTAAFTSKPNPAGEWGYCDLPIELAPGEPITTEARGGGITEVLFVFDALTIPAEISVESDCTCPSPPEYVAIDPPRTCQPGDDTLICTFSPALSNACTYRFGVDSGGGVAFVELRCLQGDVNGDGRVNGTDRSVVVGVWTGANAFSCDTDLNSSGATNATDRSIVVGGWTGAENCAP